MSSSSGSSPASSQSTHSQTQQPISPSPHSAQQNGRPRKSLTDPEATASDAETQADDHAMSVSGDNRSTLSALRRLDPVERRPELVGGVPLWLLIGAGEQLRKFAQVISSTSSHTTIATTVSDSAPMGAPSSDVSPAPPPATPETLRLLATQLEADLSDLRAELKEANRTLLVRDEQVRILEQQLADMSSTLDSDKDGNQGEQQGELHATVRRLFKELCAAQTREAAMRQRVAGIEQVRKERDSARQDIVKVFATVVLFIVLLGGRTAHYGGAWLDLIFK